jgi:hypothetical protein
MTLKLVTFHEEEQVMQRQLISKTLKFGHVSWNVYFSLALLVSVLPLGACSQYRIPEPVLQVKQDRPKPGLPYGVAEPRKKAWDWGENRWFEGEFNWQCYGRIHFIDPANKIDSYVFNGNPPNKGFDSDDQDVVLGGFNETRVGSVLIFSTDGGRHFYKEVRPIPTRRPIYFLAVRNQHIYVGTDLYYRKDVDEGTYEDTLWGYLPWKYITYEYENNKKRIKWNDREIVVLVAKIDKANHRIGAYSLLQPTNVQLPRELQETARAKYITPIDNVEALNLPRMEQPSSPASFCREKLVTQPWRLHGWGSEGAVEEFVKWFEATKKANPGWADEAIESEVEYLKRLEIWSRERRLGREQK